MRKSAAKAEMNQSRSTSQKIDHMIDHSPAPPPQLLAAPVSVQGQRRARQHHQPPQMAVFDLVRGHQQSLWLRGPSAVAGEAMASDGVVKLRPNCAGSAVCPDCAQPLSVSVPPEWHVARREVLLCLHMRTTVLAAAVGNTGGSFRRGVVRATLDDREETICSTSLSPSFPHSQRLRVVPSPSRTSFSSPNTLSTHPLPPVTVSRPSSECAYVISAR